MAAAAGIAPRGDSRRAVARGARTAAVSARSTPTTSASRLREKVVLFLDAKGIVGARGHEVTPLQRVIIAIQACVLVLNLDFAYYDGFENVIVYPGEFVPGWEWEDEAGVVHRNDAPLAGEAMPGGPVVLSWPDVEAGADWDDAGMNLVIHEFAHKIDMRDGEANGCPPLPAGMSRRRLEGRADRRVRRLLRARRSGRGHRDRSVRGRESGRVLRRAVRGVLRRPAAAARRVSGRVRAAHRLLPTGSGAAGGSPPQGIVAAPACLRWWLPQEGKGAEEGSGRVAPVVAAVLNFSGGSVSYAATGAPLDPKASSTRTGKPDARRPGPHFRLQERHR